MLHFIYLFLQFFVYLFTFLFAYLFIHLIMLNEFNLFICFYLMSEGKTEIWKDFIVVGPSNLTILKGRRLNI